MKRSEAAVAALTIVAIAVTAAGVLLGAYIKICWAIRWEDRIRGSLRLGAANHAARTARVLVGMSSSRWS
jgi:hypothetical protein